MLSNLTIFQKGLLLVAIPLVFQVIFTVLLSWQRRAEVEADQWRERSKAILFQAEHVLRLLTDVQSGIRGHAVTGDPSFAQSFEQARRSLPAALATLEGLAAPNPVQLSRAQTIKEQADRLLQAHADDEQRLQEGQREAVLARIKSGDRMRHMAALRGEMAAFVQEQERVDAQRTALHEEVHHRFSLLVGTALALAVLLTTSLVIVFSRQISRRLARVTDNTRRFSAGQELAAPLEGNDEIALLDRAFRDMTHTLVRDAAERQKAEDQVRQLNQDLAQRVRERTRALEESEGRLHAIMDNMTQGVIFSDTEGQVFHWSRAALQLHGFASMDECRLPLPEFQKYFALSTVAGRPIAFEDWPLARVLRGERISNYDLGVHRLDQGWTRTFSYGGDIVTDLTGRRIAFLTVLDISERQQAEERLQQQLARLHLLHHITQAVGEHQDLRSIYYVVLAQLEDNLPMDLSAICSYDAPSHSLRVRAVGPRSESLLHDLGFEVGSVFPVDSNGLDACIRGQLVFEADLNAVDTPFPRRLVAGGLRSLVAAPLRAGATTLGVLVIARRAPDSYSSADCEFLKQLAGHVSLAAQHAQMFEQLKKAYDELRQSQRTVLQQERLRALGQMASGIAHDINNTISPIAVYAEALLEREPNLSERARNYLTTIAQAIDDVASTVLRLRDFYRQQEKQVELKPVDLNSLVPHVVELTRARWRDQSQERGITIDLQTELAEGLPKIMGVESEIRDALINLILNAVDAMPRGGTLTLRTRTGFRSEPNQFIDTRPTHAVVEVEDSGVGMDEETRQRCLEPFFTTKGERGTGLGLAMVYGAMQRHSGDIEIDSLPGRGTTVRLLFLLPEEGVRERSSFILVPTEIVPRRILVIDDDALLRKSLEDTLHDDGHRVTLAANGREGVEAFGAAQACGEPFDVVITDLGMPHMDGRAVAESIKGLSPQTPIIMLTGWGKRMKAEGDVPAHVDRVLAKPPKLNELREALAGVVR